MQAKIAKRSGIVVGLIALGAGASMGIADAVSSSDVVIHGCYAKSTGQTRILRSGQHCTAQEYAIDWNQQGPAGARGPSGPTGPAGPSAAASPDTTS